MRKAVTDIKAEANENANNIKKKKKMLCSLKRTIELTIVEQNWGVQSDRGRHLMQCCHLGAWHCGTDAVLASRMGVHSSPNCSTSGPAPC